MDFRFHSLQADLSDIGLLITFPSNIPEADKSGYNYKHGQQDVVWQYSDTPISIADWLHDSPVKRTEVIASSIPGF